MNFVADKTYTDNVGSSSHDKKIFESHKHCANMRSSRSISTTCIEFKNAQNESNAKFFPVSVCCTSDYCMMDNKEDSSFRYVCENNECYLLKLNRSTDALEIVQAMPQGFATVEECMETYDGHPNFYPFLPTETMKNICQ